MARTWPLRTHLLVEGTSVLAVQARDCGIASYLDVHVEGSLPPPQASSGMLIEFKAIVD